MAGDINHVVLVGRLTRDPELAHTSGGTPVLRLGLAVNGRQKDEAGNWVDKPNFFDVKVFGGQAEMLSQHLAKGRRIGVEPGNLEFTDANVAMMREFLLRGGTATFDDFHGPFEWDHFAEEMKKVFPDRKIVDLANADDIFHIIYNLDDRYQVPGAQFLRSHRTYEHDGFEARWRGIYDDKGRIVVAICHNMDLGDAWQYADYPAYPAEYASLALRIAVNYVTYSMTH